MHNKFLIYYNVLLVYKQGRALKITHITRQYPAFDVLILESTA